jgi:hypothetical protein
MVRFSLRNFLVVATVCCIALGTWMMTHSHGVAAVNAMERTEFGDAYMNMRTDSPRSILPLIVVTGFTTTIYDTRTGKTTREPVARRYYLWVGTPIRLGEWHREEQC